MKVAGRISRRVMRTLGRRLVYPALEHLWSLIFLFARSLFRPTAPEIAFSGRDRVLVIAPHPDDETLACGGTIIKHAKAGDQVTVLVATDGGLSQAGGLSRATMVRQRADEVRQAIALLHPSIKLTHCALPEGHWQTSDLRAALHRSIEHLQPSVIYAPSKIDFHSEHIKVAHLLADLLSRVSNEQVPRVRVYELQVPLATPLVNCMVSIGPDNHTKLVALRRFKTQYASFGWHRRQQRYLRTWFGVPGPLEVFMEIDALSYAAMIRYASSLRPTFRSMRTRPFTDGLAWLVGTRTRIKLYKQISSRQRYSSAHNK